MKFPLQGYCKAWKCLIRRKLDLMRQIITQDAVKDGNPLEGQKILT